MEEMMLKEMICDFVNAGVMTGTAVYSSENEAANFILYVEPDRQDLAISAIKSVSDMLADDKEKQFSTNLVAEALEKRAISSYLFATKDLFESGEFEDLPFDEIMEF